LLPPRSELQSLADLKHFKDRLQDLWPNEKPFNGRLIHE
jgi:hypothetical protein